MGDLLSNVVFSGFLLILAGITLALQSGANATLNRYGGRSFAAVISFVFGTLASLIFFAVDVGGHFTPAPNADAIKAAPAYAWLGGLLGFIYVTSNIFSIPRLGAGTTLSIFVCSQVIMACVIDHLGVIGDPQRTYSTWRILASFGLVFFVFIIARF
ncbi:hypothetical protein DM01DRAFT_1403834 [Hesseltinella vesiculosa]|uniref:DUF606-domain-containing protein n=1 Tax=Hesseltinella vesiculosa TaxID=101127 RepID=A0A1X2GVS2_9FUNG|nr:hypothetical protein DM01DRAFT_1403834 [Hesseltinella vesiculosa]